MMSTGVFETCRELKETYMKKKIVHEVGYLQEPNRKFTFMGPVRILLAPFSKILELCK